MDEGSLSDTQRTMVLPLLQETNIRGKPYITVSAKGIVNGLSRYPNDGADFGPDTTKGATTPGQYGSPYTTSTGIQEAWNYALSIAYYIPTGKVNADSYDVPEIHLLQGQFFITQQVKFSGGSEQINSFKISGAGSIASDIICNVDNDYAIIIDPDTTGNTGVTFYDFSYDFPSGTSCIGFVNWNFTSSPSGDPWIIWDNVNAGTPSAGTYSSFLGSDISGVRGLFGAYISGSMASTNTLYVSATTVYYAGATTGFPINTGNSVNVYLFSPRAVTLGNRIQEATIINPQGTVTLGTSSSTNIYANISIEKLFNVGIVMNTNIDGTLVIEDVYFSVQSVTLLTSNGYATSVLKIKNVRATGNSTPLTDGKVYTSGQDIQISDIYPITYFTNIPVNDVSTPSVPASGTAQPNANQYSVDVYLNGGVVTGIQITKSGTAFTVFSNSTGLALSGQAYKLNPGDSITVTYTTAPTWEWLSD